LLFSLLGHDAPCLTLNRSNLSDGGCTPHRRTFRRGLVAKLSQSVAQPLFERLHFIALVRRKPRHVAGLSYRLTRRGIDGSGLCSNLCIGNKLAERTLPCHMRLRSRFRQAAGARRADDTSACVLYPPVVALPSVLGPETHTRSQSTLRAALGLRRASLFDSLPLWSSRRSNTWRAAALAVHGRALPGPR
tara:strand:- start:21 stop:590 length:570 start_codon:yes stop_codon:yes gene_type:complete